MKIAPNVSTPVCVAAQYNGAIQWSDRTGVSHRGTGALLESPTKIHGAGRVMADETFWGDVCGVRVNDP
jgi:hypothetical protein